MITIKELEKMELELSKLSIRAYHIMTDSSMNREPPDMRENVSSLHSAIVRACGVASVLAYELRKIERKKQQ